MSNLSKIETEKQIYDLVISTPFWNNVCNCIRATQPLLVALRVVDADEKPALPDIISATELAKNTIKNSFEKIASFDNLLLRSLINVGIHRCGFNSLSLVCY